MATEIERYIRIESMQRARNGRPAHWHTVPNAGRVRVWEMTTADALADDVAESESPKRLIFHIGYLEGVVRGCRVNYLGQTLSVLGVSDSTRLRGLELRCAPLAGEQPGSAAGPP